MGNSILSDDSVGLRAAKMLYDRLPAGTCSLHLCETGGMSLLDAITGYEALIVIDSIKTGKFPLGEVVEIDEKGPGTHRVLSSHDISLFEAINMGRRLGAHMPSKVRIFGIEVENNTEFSENLTPALEEKLEEITGRIKNRAGL